MYNEVQGTCFNAVHIDLNIVQQKTKGPNRQGCALLQMLSNYI